MAKTYTAADAGCYVDGARGQYEVSKMVIAIAQGHGFKPAPFLDDDVDEVAQEASDYMNNYHPAQGCWWGFEDGDWGLWEDSAE